MQIRKLTATVLVGTALAATTLIGAPANASKQGDYMTMVAAQYIAQQQAANQQAAYQAQQLQAQQQQAYLLQQQQLQAQYGYGYPTYATPYVNPHRHWHHW